MGQVRVIFTIPVRIANLLFPGGTHSEKYKYLAYVEWFTKFTSMPEDDTKLYKICREIQGEEQIASIVPIHNICQSIHLYPHFGRAVPQEWTSDNVLEKCPVFYTNPFNDQLSYLSIM